MASGSALVALLDDIATMTKIASEKAHSVFEAKKTRKNQSFDFSVVYRIGKGSLKNKAIVIPAALAINAVAPWAIIPILAAGGAYFCYEGVKKINYKKKAKETVSYAKKHPENCDKLLNRKVKEALRTDMVISAEITALTMLAVAASPFLTQVGILAAVGVATTVGVYSIVGGIVNMEALGEKLKSKKGKNISSNSIRALGKTIIKIKPKVMKTISIIGTASMFIVGGALILHGIPAAETAMNSFAKTIASTAMIQSIVEVAALLTGAVATGFAVNGMKHGCQMGYKKTLNIGKKKLPLFFNRKLSKQMLIAVELNSTLEAKKLLKQGASLNITNWSGETPLMRATWLGNKKLVEAFLKAGANVNKKSNTGHCSIRYSINNKRPEIKKILLKYGAKNNK